MSQPPGPRRGRWSPAPRAPSPDARSGRGASRCTAELPTPRAPGSSSPGGSARRRARAGEDRTSGDRIRCRSRGSDFARKSLARRAPPKTHGILRGAPDDRMISAADASLFRSRANFSVSEESPQASHSAAQCIAVFQARFRELVTLRGNRARASNAKSHWLAPAHRSASSSASKTCNASRKSGARFGHDAVTIRDSARGAQAHKRCAHVRTLEALRVTNR
jgi:hypothetical protein